MPQMAVKVLCSRREVLDHLAQLMKCVHNEIRECAFRRSRAHGCPECEAEDWAAAEQEVLYHPPSTVVENQDAIYIHAAAPGFDAGSLQLNVLPHSITVEGRTPKPNPSETLKVHWCELGGKMLLRQFELPARIEPEQVKAILENGILHLIARKASAAVAPGLDVVKMMKRTAAATECAGAR
jgi:HSP20 family molecular chaperone IbpA